MVYIQVQPKKVDRSSQKNKMPHFKLLYHSRSDFLPPLESWIHNFRFRTPSLTSANKASCCYATALISLNSQSHGNPVHLHSYLLNMCLMTCLLSVLLKFKKKPRTDYTQIATFVASQMVDCSSLIVCSGYSVRMWLSYLAKLCKNSGNCIANMLYLGNLAKLGSCSLQPSNNS